ncbi:MAG: WYL domain-containing protein [Spirochaetes bacterium]|nr:WYL domain-containing protein [Spirochaetota bacterium]
MLWETGRQYWIRYASESGRTTERTIDVLRLGSSGDGVTYVRAHCHLRGEDRTFRADRVLAAELVAASAGQAPFPAGSLSNVRFVERALAVAAVKASPPALRPVAASPAWASPPSPLPKPPAVVRRTFGDIVGSIIGYAVLLSMLFAFLGNTGLPEFFLTHDTSRSTASRAAPAPQPIQPPKPLFEETTIGGYLLRTSRLFNVKMYEVPALGFRSPIKAEAVSAIRTPRFAAATGLDDPGLVRRYLAADLNGSGKLSYDELAVFQDRTFRNFTYESNDLALSPDEFLAAAGGDCEDFALYTAGLLRYWGWNPYIGCFAPSATGTGHAVCLVREPGAVPAGFAFWTIEAWTSEDGTELSPGTYIPVDYDHVGSLSEAVEKGWKLQEIYLPEKAWHLEM